MKSAGLAALVLAWFCAAAAGVGATTASQPISIGLVHSTASAPVYIGIANRYFAGEGRDAKLEFFATDRLVQKAVAEGKVDFGLTNLTASFFDYAAEHRLKIIASQVSDQTGFPATALLISKSAYDAGLRNVKDFPHRRIAVPGPGSGVRYSLARIAARYGLAPDAFSLVWLQTPAREMAALSRGEVDAAALPFATALQLYLSGKGAFIIRLSNLAERQEGVVFTRAQLIETNRSTVDSFMRAYRRAVAEYDLTFQQRDDEGTVLPGPHFVDYLTLIARQANLAPEILQYSLPYSDHLARIDVTDLENQLTFWQSQGMADKSIAVTDLLDLSFAGPLARPGVSAARQLE